MIKPIPGYGGAYGCDEEGNIYSYYLWGSQDGRLTDSPRLLSTYGGGTNEYEMVNLTMAKGEHKNVLVHRLVAATWVPNPNNLPVVNHIDKNIHNNAASNLEWVTQRDNVHYGIDDFGNLNGFKTKSKLYDPDDKLIGEFDSLSAAADYCKVHYGISSSSLKKYKQSHGYYIVMDDNLKLEKHRGALKKRWILYSPSNEAIGDFPSIADAGRYIKENIRDISIKLFITHKKSYGYYVKEKCRD